MIKFGNHWYGGVRHTS